MTAHTKKQSFTKAEIAAVADYARAGIRLALMVRPDGTRVIVPASDDLAATTSDLDDRLAAFAAT